MDRLKGLNGLLVSPLVEEVTAGNVIYPTGFGISHHVSLHLKRDDILNDNLSAVRQPERAEKE